ncbi:Dihydroorotase [Croceitalea dokdonensis DOKDO 023]|uniref:Dihydroorotase n=1 Tax=Croceitalea dokdonensis DOKDO 023 TaxID=1300341 RepID=A0A0N8H408_9FLAO|nr:amidohydrolase family protein [Croceitalea dokdonensis]KPM32052.1 Dihydroorotase [Croceitalea dokdonensis DOKDO 023]
MTKIRKSVLGIILIVLLWSCQSEKTKQIEADWLIANITVIDVETGDELPNSYVAIIGDSISAVLDEQVTIQDTTKVIDGTGKYLIPSFWDMHAHVSFNHKYQQGLLVANGVAGVREMWGKMDIIDSIRQETKKGNMIAPEIYTSSAIIGGDPPYWPGSDIVGNAEQAKSVLQNQANEGVDFFKIYSLLNKDAYMAIAEESKRLGIPFAGHVPESVSLFQAIDAGQATTEHLMRFIPSCSTAEEEFYGTAGLSSFVAEKIERSLETFSQEKYDSLVQKLAKSDTWLVPTMVTKRGIAMATDTILLSVDPEINPLIKFMPAHSVAVWKMMPQFAEMKFGDGFFEANRKRYEKEMSLLGDMQDKGVKFLVGTDYANPHCYPGFSMHTEMQLLVEGGFSPFEALQAATYNPALFFKKTNEMGTVADGKVANLILLNGNPREDIGNTETIEAVFLRGVYMDRNRLDGLIEESRALAEKEINEVELPGGMPIHMHMH